MLIRQNVLRNALLRRPLFAGHLKLKGLDAKSRWLAGFWSVICYFLDGLSFYPAQRIMEGGFKIFTKIQPCFTLFNLHCSDLINRRSGFI
jgi:hypothetical protein